MFASTIIAIMSVVIGIPSIQGIAVLIVNFVSNPLPIPASSCAALLSAPDYNRNAAPNPDADHGACQRIYSVTYLYNSIVFRADLVQFTWVVALNMTTTGRKYFIL